MGHSWSQRVNSSSSSSGLGFYISYSVNGYLAGFSNQKSIFIPKHSQPDGGLGLAVILINSNPNNIVFPPTLIALDILYSAPSELWNWNHPTTRDFRVTRGISARDGIVIPTSPSDITRSEEYTCVVSKKDGYPKMTHLYGDIVVDCHPIPGSMVAATLGHGRYDEDSDDRLYEEVLKHCYICQKLMKQMNEIFMHKDEVFGNEERDNKETEAKKEINGNKD